MQPSPPHPAPHDDRSAGPPPLDIAIEPVRSLVAERPRHRWWVYLFALLGVVAATTVVVSLFFSIGRRPEALHATEVPPVTDPDFLTALAGGLNAPVRSGGTALVLHNGREIWPALLRDIEAAQKTVNFMVYIWEPGRLSDSVFAVLTRKARQGVEVRLLLDGLGAMDAPEAQVRALREAGGQVGVFRPLRLGWLTRFHKRNHRRAIVIDGEVGYTGGAAVADEWLGDARNPSEWRDDMFRVTGPLARSLQAAFAQLWTPVTGELLVGPDFFPLDPPAPAPGIDISRHVALVSSPGDDSHPLRKWFWLSFMAARQRLWITTPYFVTDDALRLALAQRARAGVDVRLLLPSRRTDAPMVRLASHHYYQELLRAGVKIYEYQPTMLHAKRLVADGLWSVIGSANLDVRSKELNEEVVLGILDSDLARQQEQTFRADLRRAEAVSLAAWQQRPWWARVLERLALLFAEQY